MKKYLMSLILIALVQVAFAAPIMPDDKPLNDSIIVEFGQSGKMVFVIDNPDDFERLKNMDINQIIKELDLPTSTKDGELTVVEIKQKDGHREIVTIYEDIDETEVTVGRYKVIVDETGNRTKVKLITGPKKEKILTSEPI
ncbi:hypothetical protein [Cyclobacterium qasimii]|uniref:Uncharacterized protein n=1 Tax=Cyclobacterium qasimii M12-11B TaxID=641524 RepID=S7VB92_9BACT|nr:hypothetical protein [Cyclobacterium qasimii]EPR67510.1 hypothetical protein ADICYQ_3534 [Cyclobacterium qasimii M12-11B]